MTFESGETEKTFVFAAHDGQDDDDESVLLAFGELPLGVSLGTNHETIINITDDDDPSVVVYFQYRIYAVTEGRTVDIHVLLDRDPERTLEIPLDVDFLRADNSDYSGIPENVTFNPGETSTSFTVEATGDSEADEDEEVRLSFGTLPPRVSTRPDLRRATIQLEEASVPGVTVEPNNFTVKEGEIVTYVVFLNSMPSADVTIALSARPSVSFSSDRTSLTFTTANWGEEQRVTVTAKQALYATDERVSVEHTTSSSDPDYNGIFIHDFGVNTIDNDAHVQFEETTHSVAEWASVTMTVTVSRELDETVSIPIDAQGRRGASPSDFTVVPDSVTFEAGQRR